MQKHKTNLVGTKHFEIAGRRVGPGEAPLVIAEAGINHEGDMDKAILLVEDAARAGCECIKFQCHIIDDEMIPNDVAPAHTDESIWDIMNRCALDERQEREIKALVESKGMIYISTPFSRAAADRLESMNVPAFKIGSGECNNYPLIRHIAGFGKPVILSTGMNDIGSIRPGVELLRNAGVPFALMHCTSLYPTPYEMVRLGALRELQDAFPDTVVGLSDHSLGNYACFGAVALGACILERHFTSDMSWHGPDIAVSMDPEHLEDLVRGSKAIHSALGGKKEILAAEKPTIDFAYASVVAICDIESGEELSMTNVWVKRPGTGEIRAANFESILGRTVKRAIAKNSQLAWSDIA